MHRLRNNGTLCCLTLLAMILVTAGCSQPFPDGLDPWLLSNLAALMSPTQPPPVTPPVTPDARKFIFVTVGTHNGNLGGVSGADGICAAEKTANFPALPGAATEYDALLTDGAARVACVNANCTPANGGDRIDWVLAANTNYYRSDEQLLFQTNGDGIFDFGSGSFSLTNPFSASGSDEWWTGLYDTWTVALDTCTGWTVTGVQGQAGVGGGTAVDGTSISNLNPGCITPLHLLCVRR